MRFGTTPVKLSYRGVSGQSSSPSDQNNSSLFLMIRELIGGWVREDGVALGLYLFAGCCEPEPGFTTSTLAPLLCVLSVTSEILEVEEIVGVQRADPL